MSDDRKAVRLLKISADQGNGDAQFKLGSLYTRDTCGLPKMDWREAEAERLFRRAARQGHAGARECLELYAPPHPIAKWLYMRGLGRVGYARS